MYYVEFSLVSSDQMKSMLMDSQWKHEKTDLSLKGPMTLDVHSKFKLRKGEIFIKSRKYTHSNGLMQKKNMFMSIIQTVITLSGIDLLPAL